MKQQKKSLTEVIITAVVASVVTSAVMLLDAQFIIWGLSMFRISSGIWPVWLIGSGFGGILTLSVASGVRAVANG